jgi:hypothetical protein
VLPHFSPPDLAVKSGRLMKMNWPVNKRKKRLQEILSRIGIVVQPGPLSVAILAVGSNTRKNQERWR